jgi:GT2 family glycosyltransferase
MKGLEGLGYQRIAHVPKSSYKDSSMVIIVPSREPYLHHTFVQHLQALAYPMNQARAMFFVSGAEVGKAYSEMIQMVLDHPELSKWKYLLTLEDDTLPPPDAVLKLVESIELGPFDGVGGMYWTKGDVNMPMMYGDPAEFARTGVLDFRPRHPLEALNRGEIVEVNGIANGCTLFRLDSFRKVPGPWFQTLEDPTKGGCGTQDLVWCSKARRAGQRFAVDARVRCGHADWKSGTVY